MSGVKRSCLVVILGILFAVSCSASETQNADVKKSAPPKPEVYSAVEDASDSKTPVKKSPTSIPPLLAEVEAKYSAAATLEADFIQVSEISSLSRKKTSSGILWLKRPDKFRWQTNEPDPNLLVSDGARFWYYTPPFEEGENGQVIVRKSSEMQTDLAQALLAGSFSAARDVTISPKGKNLFIVVPKPGTAGTVKQAEVEIDLAKKIIKKVTLVHEGGNRSEIKLSRVDLGKKLEDTMFKFKAPPGTEVVKQ